jgi:hypothetical protein
MTRMRCNKTDRCNGRVDLGRKKTGMCPHHGEHEFVINISGRPWWRVTCGKAEQCPNQDKQAICEVLPEGKNTIPPAVEKS